MHEDPVPVLGAARLGYGCASLMARTGRRESLRLLEAAFEAGITHFDVARSYGYGEAEDALGRFISGRRDQVTVTTKLGIAAPPRQRALGAAKKLARAVAAVSPRARAALRGRASGMVAHGRFGAAEARESFEQSLRELRTDHVDVLLLHDPRPDDVGEELLEFLDRCVVDGTARAVGVASGREEVRAISAAHGDRLTVAQLPDSALEPELPAALAPRARTVVTHSVVEGPLRALGRELDRERLPALLLASALRRNPNGVVLVSSRDPAHLRANAALVSDPPPDDELDALDQLVAR